MDQPEMCVIFNPKAGRGKSVNRIDQLRSVLGNRAEFRATQYPGHAEGLACEAARSGFSVVGAAGGDGTVHEVANGILTSERSEVALAVFPLGSANDYAFCLGLEPEWWKLPSDRIGIRAVDVGVARNLSGKERYFINGLGLGFNGAVTLEARKIRYLRGIPLYALGLLRALIYRFSCPPMRILFDERFHNVPTLALTVALGQREGNFLLTPDAIIDDGLFDYLQAGSLRRLELIRYLPRMVTGRLPHDHPKIWMGRCRRVLVESETPLTAHLNGEFFCLPEDDVTNLQVEILPGRLGVQCPVAEP